MLKLSKTEFRSKVGGTLLGTALGDALGLITERLDRDEIRKRFGRVNRFHLLGDHGFVSDDTEQSVNPK